MKKVLAILLALLIGAATLTGCGNDNTTEGTSITKEHVLNELINNSFEYSTEQDVNYEATVISFKGSATCNIYTFSYRTKNTDIAYNVYNIEIYNGNNAVIAMGDQGNYNGTDIVGSQTIYEINFDDQQHITAIYSAGRVYERIDQIDAVDFEEKCKTIVNEIEQPAFDLLKRFGKSNWKGKSFADVIPIVFKEYNTECTVKEDSDTTFYITYTGPYYPNPTLRYQYVQYTNEGILKLSIDTSQETVAIVAGEDVIKAIDLYFRLT